MDDWSSLCSFRPIFRASDLGNICMGLSEENELKMLIKYSPFSECAYMLKSNRQEKRQRITINKTHKDFIKDELKHQFSKSLKFNDELVFLKLLAHIAFDTLEIGEIQSEYYQKIIHSFISTQRGRQLEPLILRQVNEQENRNFNKDIEIKKISFELFDICGIPDGIDPNVKKIIEIKTRSDFDELMNEYPISPIEEIQCMCYMRLTGCYQCIFLEHGPNGEQRKHELIFNQNDFDQQVVQKLTAFVLKYKTISKREFLELVSKYPNSFTVF